MDAFVGTSGGSFGWNQGGSLNWYAGYSGLNAVELNASFSRFPFHNQVTSLAKRGTPLPWCVKVHRSVTHLHRFNEAARASWRGFLDLFRPLDSFVDWYLFPASPSLRDTAKLISFFEGLESCGKCTPEIRNRSLLLDDGACDTLLEHVHPESVDSPDARNRIFGGGTASLRMHGRHTWYDDEYPETEPEETAGLIRQPGAGKAYVFFNNDHAMLANVQRMPALLRSPPGGGEGAHDHDGAV